MAWGPVGVNQWITGREIPTLQYVYSVWLELTLNHFFLSLKGKWCHVDCPQVRQKYFTYMLHCLGNSMLDSVCVWCSPPLSADFQKKGMVLLIQNFQWGNFWVSSRGAKHTAILSIGIVPKQRWGAWRVRDASFAHSGQPWKYRQESDCPRSIENSYAHTLTYQHGFQRLK